MTIYVISYFVSPKTTMGMCFGILGFIIGLFSMFILFYLIMIIVIKPSPI